MSPQESLYQPLALFVPNSAGDSQSLLELTLQAASQTIPLLAHLMDVAGRPKLAVVPVASVDNDARSMAAAEELKALFTRFGSDKSAGHDYHVLYGALLKDRREGCAVLEFGLGSNNPDVASNMGSGGIPGASLRAWREFLPDASIFGADIDMNALFQEHRIQTFYVDQTDLLSLEALGTRLPTQFDLIIDDGLHAPNANLAVLAFALDRLKPSGWLVIEDIPERAVPLWQVAAALLPSTFACQLLRAEGGLLFAVQRLPVSC